MHSDGRGRVVANRPEAGAPPFAGTKSLLKNALVIANSVASAQVRHRLYLVMVQQEVYEYSHPRRHCCSSNEDCMDRFPVAGVPSFQ